MFERQKLNTTPVVKLQSVSLEVGKLGRTLRPSFSLSGGGGGVGEGAPYSKLSTTLLCIHTASTSTGGKQSTKSRAEGWERYEPRVHLQSSLPGKVIFHLSQSH